MQWRERTVKARIKLLRKAGWRLRSTGACAGILASVALERKANRLSSACDKRPGSSISTSLLVEFYWLCVSETNKAASRPASDAQPHQNNQSKCSICLSWGGIKARCKKKKTQKKQTFHVFLSQTQTSCVPLTHLSRNRPRHVIRSQNNVKGRSGEDDSRL